MNSALIGMLMACAAISAWVRGKNGYNSFLEGAKEGIQTALRILPCLVAMMCAVAMLRASGLMEMMEKMTAVPFRALGIPVELTGLILVRPLSGSAALGVLGDLYSRYGTDSVIGKTASVMMGSTETIFYTVALYFGSVGIRKSRYAVPAALIAMAAGTLASVWLVRWL